ncbi:MAG: hypothetical protein PHT46_04720 [Candidatus Marinimicrobia bacterium]|jgi:hypothetical protein|nr:hypothetical protein [Candidatus Neomarinimicrobiota bacterium]
MNNSFQFDQFMDQKAFSIGHSNIEIPITRQNLFMMQRQFSVKDHISFFPFDVIGAMNPSNNVDKNYRVRTITLNTDAGFTIETDIVEKTFVFRNRSTAKGTTRYMSEKNVKPGDTIVIEKISSYEYNMKLKRGEA